MNALPEVIRAIYRQVDAPRWASTNLDGLTDILRDLLWLAPGPVEITVPDLSALPRADADALRLVLARVVAETRESVHPVQLLV